MPRSLWQWSSIGILTHDASCAILSYIENGSSYPSVSQYLNLSAPASFAASPNSIRYPISLLEASSAFMPIVFMPLFFAVFAAKTILFITSSFVNFPLNLPCIICSEVDIERLRCLTLVISVAFITSSSIALTHPSSIIGFKTPLLASSRLALR